MRSALDQAVWFYWSDSQRKTLSGMIVSYVDDLLFGGNHLAEASLLQVGDELGFRDVTRNAFTWCGKYFCKKEDGTITLSMKAYHENLREVYLPKPRRSDVLRLCQPLNIGSCGPCWGVSSGLWHNFVSTGFLRVLAAG